MSERTLNAAIRRRHDEEPRREALPSPVRFGPFELDLDLGILQRGGERVPLRPAATRTLVLLVRGAGTLVSREELRRHLWGDAFVEWETGLHQCIRQVRHALGDQAGSPTYVETVPRRGYRFIASVEVEETAGSHAVASTTPDRRRIWPIRWRSFVAGVATAVAVPAVAIVLCSLLAP